MWMFQMLPKTQSGLISARSIPLGSGGSGGSGSGAWIHIDPVRCFEVVSRSSSGSRGGAPVHRMGAPGTDTARCDSVTPSRSARGNAIPRSPYVGFRRRFPAGVVHDAWGVPKSVGVRTWTDETSRTVDAGDRQKTTRKVMWRTGMIEGWLVAANQPACEAEGIPTGRNHCPVDSEGGYMVFRSTATWTYCGAPSRASSAPRRSSKTCLRPIPLAGNIPTVSMRRPRRRPSRPLPLRPCPCGGFDVWSTSFDG